VESAPWPSADVIIKRLKFAVDFVKTDADLARELGVSRSAIGNWRARNAVPLDRVLPFCQKYAVPIDFLMTGHIGSDRDLPPPMDKELLAFLLRQLAHDEYISLPNAREDSDPADLAAARLAYLQSETARLIQLLTADGKMKPDDAKRALFLRYGKQGPQ
jgi:hypothetical protein